MNILGILQQICMGGFYTLIPEEKGPTYSKKKSIWLNFTWHSPETVYFHFKALLKLWRSASVNFLHLNMIRHSIYTVDFIIIISTRFKWFECKTQKPIVSFGMSWLRVCKSISLGNICAFFLSTNKIRTSFVYVFIIYWLLDKLA